MADKDDKQKADEKKEKILGKFDTVEDALKAYGELEKEHGARKKEMGDVKKQAEEAQLALAQYAQMVNQLKPYADWYTQTQQALTQYQQWAQATQNGTLQPQNGNAAAQRAVEILTAEEKQALINAASQHFNQSVFMPWRQQYDTSLRQMAEKERTTVQEALGNQLKAYTEVMWRTLEKAMPDKMGDIRKWHESALKFADTSKLDPLQAASDVIDLQAKLSALETEKAAFEKEREAYQKRDMGSLSGAGEAPAAWAAKDETAPKTREERMRRVFNDTTEKVGRDAMREMFPGSGTLR